MLGGEWIVAEWSWDEWYVAGVTRTKNDNDLEKIDEHLIPPPQ